MNPRDGARPYSHSPAARATGVNSQVSQPPSPAATIAAATTSGSRAAIPSVRAVKPRLEAIRATSANPPGGPPSSPSPAPPLAAARPTEPI